MGGWSRLQRFCDICGWWRLAGHHRRALDSARLLPCASSFSEEVVEGTHDVMAEGTGLEPYSPCQGLVRGQGGFQDVHACVDLSIHFPVAHLADEILAYPVSAPRATRWAGLAGPLRVDLDDRHAREGGLVFDLAVDLATWPRAEATVHFPRAATRALEGEVFEDDRRLLSSRPRDQSLTYLVEPLDHPVPLSPSFAGEQTASDPTVIGLLPTELPSSTKVRRLHLADAAEGKSHEPHLLAFRLDAVQGVFVRVEGDRQRGLVWLRRAFSDRHDNPLRRDGQRAEPP